MAKDTRYSIPGSDNGGNRGNRGDNSSNFNLGITLTTIGLTLSTISLTPSIAVSILTPRNRIRRAERKRGDRINRFLSYKDPPFVDVNNLLIALALNNSDKTILNTFNRKLDKDVRKYYPNYDKE